MNIKALITLIAVVLCPVATWADYKEIRTLTLPAANLSALAIDCGAGSLTVEGVEGLTNIEVVAEIVVEDASKKDAIKFIEDRIKLILEKRNGEARLVADSNDSVRGWIHLFDRTSARINLEVRIPATMHLEVYDGSGEIKIENLGAGLRVEDGSGSTRIENVAGEVRIDDGSGDLRITDVRGDLEVEDGSGDIRIVGVTGDVTIEDGSGSLRVHDVAGNVEVDDGSGHIDIDGVENNVIIIDEGSGGHDIDNVKGQVRWQ